MKYAVCNELFEHLSLKASCKLAAEYGFSGLELAPYTLAESPRRLVREEFSEVKTILSDFEMTFVGLHWLLNVPEGLHLTVPDASVRKISWDAMKYLVEFCGMMGGGVMVLGSGRKRNAERIPLPTAMDYLKEGLIDIAPLAEAANTKILIEPLSKTITNVINTLEEAQGLIQGIDGTAVGSIFDFHNCVHETRSWPDLIDTYTDIIHHVHFNEIDGGYPGSGGSNFMPAFKALHRNNYSGWVSLEVFNVTDPPEQVLESTAREIQKIEEHIEFTDYREKQLHTTTSIKKGERSA